MPKKKAGLDEFRSKLKNGSYKNIAGAHRAIGKMGGWNQKERDEATALADRHFAAGAEAAPAPKAAKERVKKKAAKKSVKKVAKKKGRKKAAKKKAASAAGVGLSEFEQRLKDGHYTNVAGARRAAGKVKGWSTDERQTARAMVEEHFNTGEQAPRKESKGKKKAAKASKPSVKKAEADKSDGLEESIQNTRNAIMAYSEAVAVLKMCKNEGAVDVQDGLNATARGVTRLIGEMDRNIVQPLTEAEKKGMELFEKAASAVLPDNGRPMAPQPPAPPAPVMAPPASSPIVVTPPSITKL